MEALKLNKETAIKLYPTAAPEFKKMLEETFGERALLGNIIERVTGFESACEELGTTPRAELSRARDEYERAEVRIKTMAKALREGKPEKDCIYYPYFGSSAAGFSYNVFVCAYVCTRVWARLRVDSAEKAEHLGKIMLSDYKIYLGK